MPVKFLIRPSLLVIALLSGPAMAQDYVARFSLSGTGGDGAAPGTGGNSDPVAEAGADQTVASGATVTLSGSGSTDPDPGDVLSYAWSQTGGPGVSLSDATAVSPTFTAPTLAPADPSTDLIFSLVVSDDQGGVSSADTVTITVDPPAAPATCETPGQTCGDGTAVFARENGGEYIYASGIYPPAYWHVAQANCEALGAGWTIFESAYKNALALPGDPFGVDFTAPNIWGHAAVSGTSGGFVPGVGMVTNYTWSSFTWNIATSSGNGVSYPSTGAGNFDTSLSTYSPFAVQQDTEALGTHSDNTAPPENTTMSRPYLCMLITTSPLPS